MPTITTEGRPDDTDDHHQARALETQIRERVNPTLSRTLNGTFDDDSYLATSWLAAIHTHVRRRQGDPRRSTANWPRDRYLAAIANRLGLEYEALRDTDPIEELTRLADALEELD